MPISKIYIENATIFRYRCRFIVRYILHDHGDIELCIQQFVNITRTYLKYIFEIYCLLRMNSSALARAHIQFNSFCDDYLCIHICFFFLFHFRSFLDFCYRYVYRISSIH